jgi:arylesterase / paraoxonase
MKKTMKVILLILLLVSLFAAKVLWQSGLFKKIENKFSGTTRIIEGLPGVEDLTIDQTTGIAFLSSDDRWASRLHKQKVKGAIYKLNLNDSIPIPFNLTPDFPLEDFHPHGISLFQTPEGRKILFVINHRDSANYIERFEYRNDSLKYLGSKKDELIISPNDIVGVGENSFYFTNDHNEKLSKWRGIKDFMTIGTGNVGYFDGEKVSITSIEGVKYANGINISQDGKKLFLAATIGRTISTYDRDIASGALIKTSELNTGTGVDNIELDAEGNLLVGCHPQLLKFASHAGDENKISPSEIIRLRWMADGSFEQETIYINDGTEISASSVGAIYKDMLLIGPVFQGHIVIGKMK